MKKYELTFIKNLKPMHVAEYFEAGDLVHQMLRTYYNLRRYQSRWAANNRSHNDIVEICVRVGQYFLSKMDLPIADGMYILKCFREYCYMYENDSWEILAVEQVASKILHEDSNLRIIYEGKIDLVVRTPGLPKLVVDHKTSKRRQDASELSNQFMGYCWLLGTNNVVVNKIGLQTTLKAMDRNHRQILSYTPAVIDRWVSNTVWWIKYGLSCAMNKEFPMNFTSCDKWAGCVFAPICSLEDNYQQSKLDEMFIVSDEWDVGKGL
jgi:hypothetical protein